MNGHKTWDAPLHRALREDLTSARGKKYKFDSIRDLLRAIRNKLAHLDQAAPEAAPEVQKLFGGISVTSVGGVSGEQQQDAFLSYWTSRFPDLCLSLYLLAPLAEDPRLATFFS
ncbi:hypothetical protein T484DRAFT_1796264 [Baffinella frigidus]|nr:hypothetical protein T484DRAFT_1796264 [Cryptophyta sp. CCMP2293]